MNFRHAEQPPFLLVTLTLGYKDNLFCSQVNNRFLRVCNFEEFWLQLWGFPFAIPSYSILQQTIPVIISLLSTADNPGIFP
jgi:hypothetical protein